MEPEILKEAKVRVCGDFEIDLKEDILSDVPQINWGFIIFNRNLG